MPCWSRAAIITTATGKAVQGTGAAFFKDVQRGVNCQRNWYEHAGAYHSSEGRNGALLGVAGRLPNFTAPAPALLGWDIDIRKQCNEALGRRNHNRHLQSNGDRCVEANLNILKLDTNLYSSCRNLEWQTCAALGQLPGQRSRSMIFGRPPGSLVWDPEQGTLGRCRSHAFPGFMSRDVFALEASDARS